MNPLQRVLPKRALQCVSGRCLVLKRICVECVLSGGSQKFIPACEWTSKACGLFQRNPPFLDIPGASPKLTFAQGLESTRCGSSFVEGEFTPMTLYCPSPACSGTAASFRETRRHLPLPRFAPLRTPSGMAHVPIAGVREALYPLAVARLVLSSKASPDPPLYRCSRGALSLTTSSTTRLRS
jgi:hypothetical protein